MTGALVAQAAIAAILFSPVKGALQDGFDVVVLLYPLADVLLMGLVAAAVAHGGWRLDFWAVSLAGLVAITIGDSSALATSIVGDHVQGGAADLGWLAGTWLLAVAAWSPEPKRTPDLWVRSAVPVVLGTAALGIVVITAFSPHPLIPTLACASGALAVVVGRLAITLHDNNLMLSVARTDSVTDALTGLGNRRQLMADLEDELDHATETSQAALALFDLNGFKDYNDTYGHPAGDALLAALGTDLAESVEGIGAAYRMGGDEFCVLVHAGATDHHAIAERAAEALSAAARGFTVTAAHGVVLLPGEAATASDALRRADVRMYEDKSGSRVGSRRQVTQALMLAIEERDRALHGHGEGVQELASCVARRLGLSATDADAVRLGALLHDVGKLAIPDRILEKRGPLDPYEWEFMRSHTLIGQRILEGAPALRDVAGLVRASHEHFDGTGYPDGLRGEDIPAGARIIAVCDAFDAMTRHRVYQPAVPAEAALAELRRCAGTQFDPAVVQAFAEAHEAARRRAHRPARGLEAASLAVALAVDRDREPLVAHARLGRYERGRRRRRRHVLRGALAGLAPDLVAGDPGRSHARGRAVLPAPAQRDRPAADRRRQDDLRRRRAAIERTSGEHRRVGVEDPPAELRRPALPGGPAGGPLQEADDVAAPSGRGSCGA